MGHYFLSSGLCEAFGYKNEITFRCWFVANDVHMYLYFKKKVSFPSFLRMSMTAETKKGNVLAYDNCAH